jgi:hypothetical protein
MLKDIEIMKDQSLIQIAQTALQDCLKTIPFLQIVHIETSGNDFQVVVGIKENVRSLLVKIKNNGQPRIARQAVYELKDSLKIKTDTYGIIFAPYISPDAGKICGDAGIGYLDLAGNCLLSFETVYIRQTGTPNPKILKRDLRSLYSPKAERILRALFMEPQRIWKLTELAQTVGVSLGQVSNVKKLLLDKEWARAPFGGLTLTRMEALLDEWALAYNFRRNEVQDYYAMAEIPEIEAQIADSCRQLGLRYALTGFSSAARIAPMVRYQKASVYVQGDVPSMAQTLGWKSVQSGANISLLIPYDDGVFYGAKDQDEISITAPLQTYLDLQNYRGRGQEAAQAVRKEMEKSCY